MNSKVSTKQRSLIFVNIIIVCVASSMLATSLTTALPAMAADLQITVSTAQWLTSGYSLAMGIMMPLTAFLITRFPTKKLYITAIGLFISGLVVCLFSSSFAVLMAGRVLQACGSGMLNSMSQVILLTIYPPEKRGSIMGWYGLTIGAAPVLAPTIAGIVVDISSWRMIFLGAAVIMLISLAFAIKVFANVIDIHKQKFDIFSFLLSGLAFGGVTLGIGNIGSYPLLNIHSGLPLAAGILAGAVFAKRQFHLSDPFLDLNILKNGSFSVSLVGSMLLYLIMMGSSIILPIYIQTMLGFSATISGLVMLPGALVMAVVSPFTGRIYDRFGMKLLFLAGSLSLLVSNLGMSFVSLHTSLVIVILLNSVNSLAIGCLMMPLVTWGMHSLSDSQTAHGTALLTGLRTIAGAIGSAVFVGVMASVAKNSAPRYGELAQIHGMNIAFLGISTAALALLALALISQRKKTAIQMENSEPETLEEI